MTDSSTYLSCIMFAHLLMWFLKTSLNGFVMACVWALFFFHFKQFRQRTKKTNQNNIPMISACLRESSNIKYYFSFGFYTYFHSMQASHFSFRILASNKILAQCARSEIYTHKNLHKRKRISILRRSSISFG